MSEPRPSESAALLANYRAGAGYDECVGADGQPRAHWEYLLRALEGLGAHELSTRRREARRMLREHGVTYNVYDDAQPDERLWPLDPIPLLMPSAEG